MLLRIASSPTELLLLSLCFENKVGHHQLEVRCNNASSLSIVGLAAHRVELCCGCSVEDGRKTEKDDSKGMFAQGGVRDGHCSAMTCKQEWKVGDRWGIEGRREN